MRSTIFTRACRDWTLSTLEMILPRAAFVDTGNEKNGYLCTYITDIMLVPRLRHQRVYVRLWSSAAAGRYGHFGVGMWQKVCHGDLQLTQKVAASALFKPKQLKDRFSGWLRKHVCRMRILNLREDNSIFRFQLVDTGFTCLLQGCSPFQPDNNSNGKDVGIQIPLINQVALQTNEIIQ